MIAVYPDADALAAAVVEEFVAAAADAVAARGRFVVALAGGSTPKAAYARLAEAPHRDRVDWTRTWILFGDERFVPPSDSASNEAMARASLLSHVPVPEAQVLGMVRQDAPEAAAQDYDARLRDLLAADPIDLVLLGLGTDAHTASLFPGDPAVHERERWVVVGTAPVEPRTRLTLTPKVLTAARRVRFVVSGADKAAALERLLDGPEDWDETPSQAILRHAPDALVLADAAADAGRT